MKRKQAQLIAKNFFNGKFGVYAHGNFDLSEDEFATALMLCDSLYSEITLAQFYEDIKPV